MVLAYCQSSAAVRFGGSTAIIFVGSSEALSLAIFFVSVSAAHRDLNTSPTRRYSDIYLNNLKKRSSLVFKKWHDEFKRKDKIGYYKTQHERFKKIGEDKFKTKKGENVRNLLEKKFANLFCSDERKVPINRYEGIVPFQRNFFSQHPFKQIIYVAHRCRDVSLTFDNVVYGFI